MSTGSLQHATAPAVISLASGVGANRDSMRRHNLATMLRAIHSEGPIARSHLTSHLGLTRSTIGDLLEELQRLGLTRLVDRPRPPGSVGRASPEVRLVADRAQTIAVHLGRDLLRAARIGVGGTVLARLERPTVQGQVPDSIAEAIVEMMRELTADVSAEAAILGVCVGVPGMVAADGLIRLAPSLGWADVPFGEILAGRLQSELPITLVNDGDLGALAEHLRGAGVGSAHMVFVGCDDLGVGAGVIHDGRPLRGVGGLAGELGHMVVVPGGRRCACGRNGCWETEIGAARVAEELGLDGQDLRAMADALAGLSTAPPGLETVGRYLGLGLGNIINAFNPGLIILGGTLRDLYPAVRRETDAAMAQTALPAARAQARVVISELGPDAVLVGGAETAMEPLLRDPVRVLATAPHGRLV